MIPEDLPVGRASHWHGGPYSGGGGDIEATAVTKSAIRNVDFIIIKIFLDVIFINRCCKIIGKKYWYTTGLLLLV